MRVIAAGLVCFLLAAAVGRAEPAAPARPSSIDASLPSGRLMAPEPVTDHVWVMRQPDRLWAAVIGNVEIIEQSDGVVLVDSGGTIADGEDVVAAVAELTPKPIKAVIITHWHNDHPLGIPAVLAKFPKARIIATDWTKQVMSYPDVLKVGIGKVDTALRDKRIHDAEETAAEFRRSAADPALTAEERHQFAIEAVWVMERAKRQLANYVVLPTEGFADQLTIDDPVAPVQALYLGRANTRGDAIVWLARQKVMISGDAVVLPTPYGFSDLMQPWLATLDRMEKYDFKILIPGHGKVQRDRSYLATLRWSLADIRKQADALAGTDATKEEAAKRFDRAKQRRRFGANDPWTRRWLDAYWLDGMFEVAFKQARNLPVESGTDGGE
jgi:glyoxylase-like metal-dependent hydrolase (beta-lactamase superfamily II)